MSICSSPAAIPGASVRVASKLQLSSNIGRALGGGIGVVSLGIFLHVVSAVFWWTKLFLSSLFLVSPSTFVFMG